MNPDPIIARGSLSSIYEKYITAMNVQISKNKSLRQFFLTKETIESEQSLFLFLHCLVHIVVLDCFLE